MKFFVISICMVFFCVACSKSNDETVNTKDSKKIAESSVVEERVVVIDEKQAMLEAQTAAIVAFLNTMTLEQKIAQLFLVSVNGVSATISATEYSVPPGGYVLFTHNAIGGAEQLIKLTGEIQTFYSEKQEIPPFFSIDHEGGDVNRLRNVASPLPSAKSVAKYLTQALAGDLYSYAARQIAALGIQVNLAPVVEVIGVHNEQFLGSRSFGSLEEVETFAGTFIESFSKNDVYCVLKHFPGNNNDDPHFGLPVLNENKETILSLYVESFRRLLGNNGLLMSHAIVTAFDEKNPACLSPLLIQNLVNQELGFDGLIFSDDILMGALFENGYPPEIAINMALRAGVHVLMISNSNYWDFIPNLMQMASDDANFALLIDNAVVKILEAKITMGLMMTQMDEQGELVLVPCLLSELYNPARQLEQFTEAKLLGEALYYEYWAE